MALEEVEEATAAVLEEEVTAAALDSVVELVTEVVASNTKKSVLYYDQFLEDDCNTNKRWRESDDHLFFLNIYNGAIPHWI